MLLNIAGSAQLPQEEVVLIAKELGKNFDDEELKNTFFDILIQLYVHLTCIFGLCNC
jgi:hypothetical protein